MHRTATPVRACISLGGTLGSTDAREERTAPNARPSPAPARSASLQASFACTGNTRLASHTSTTTGKPSKAVVTKKVSYP